MQPNAIIPVILFAYRRADLLAKTLASLRENAVPLLYAFSDAPAGPEDQVGVSEVRAQLRAIDWCETYLIERPHNLGLGCSVLQGVTRVLSEHEAAVIFEDDLVGVPGTYEYLVRALSAYRDIPRVMSVTAWTHPAITPDGLGKSPYFDGKGECWAWGTWRRAWRGMERTAMELMRALIRRGGDAARYGPDMPVMASEEVAKNLWAVRWWYHHMLHSGLCLRPPWSMVEHTGWDERATTTLEGMDFWRNPPLRAALQAPSVWLDATEHPDMPKLWTRAIHASAFGPFPSLDEISGDESGCR